MARRRKDENLWENKTTGRWHWEISLTRKDGTVYRKGGSSKEKNHAIKNRDAAVAQFNNFEAKAGKWTVQSWGEHVAANIWPNELSQTTADAYAYALKNHVYPILGGAKLDGLTVPRLQEWANAIQTLHETNVAKNARTAFSSLLTRAVKNDLLPQNPLQKITLKKAANSTREEGKMILTPDQQKSLIRASKGTPMEMPILLGLKFGLRIGECLGLRWEDVDLTSNVIKIKQQAQYVRGKGVQIVDPKTKHGTRVIPIPESVRPILSAAKLCSSSAYVCTHNEKLIPSKKAPHMFKAVAVAAGFTEETGIPTHHDCRSTFLTHLANEANHGQGLKPHLLMAIAGHSSIETTMKYYVRASDADLRSAMACVIW